jgi:hypothetical protein
MTYIKVDDDMADKIIRDGLLESYFSTEEMIERLEERQEEGEEIKPYQQEDLDYNRKYLKALQKVIQHFSVGGNFNIEAERLDYYERELNYERDSYSPGLTESEDEDEI